MPLFHSMVSTLLDRVRGDNDALCERLQFPQAVETAAATQPRAPKENGVYGGATAGGAARRDEDDGAQRRTPATPPSPPLPSAFDVLAALNCGEGGETARMTDRAQHLRRPPATDEKAEKMCRAQQADLGAGKIQFQPRKRIQRSQPARSKLEQDDREEKCCE